ncbi:ComF family protein [Devosia sp. MC521]|uniref:ComF family protein n=2 Tax=Devosia sp. MC521 TaxID=2759954 RepID=UPI0032BF59D8
MSLMKRGGSEVKAGALRRVREGLAWAGASVLDQLYPPCCGGCGAPLAEAQGLCGACFAKLRPITAPLCSVMGIPVEAEGGDFLSAEAIADPPPFARARASVHYNEMAGALVAKLKYGDRPELAKLCARLMVGAGREFWSAKPVLVPVPLHASRLRFRRYNQSMMLAQEIARLVGLEVDAFVVRRKRKTAQQVGLSGDRRLRNVQGAFATHPHALERLKGRGVVIVDDVYTTGATVKAVTRALKRAGVEKIDVLSFARVVIGDDNPI